MAAALNVVVLVFLLHVNLAWGAGAGYGLGNQWTYQWNTLLGNWGTNYPKCAVSNNGKQSPINIESRDTTYDGDKLKLNNYDDVADVYFNMGNVDTSIGFVAKNDDGDVPQTVEFKGTTYRLYQFHFHWGSQNFQGSEHLLDSQQYGAELHIIHYNTKYANAGEAIDQDDGLLVWGHFMKVDSNMKSGNAVMEKLVRLFGSAAKKSNGEIKVTGVNMAGLIPAASEDFFTYSGSLTTPPCHESVRWIVNKNPISVSANQMAEFRMLQDQAMGSTDVNKVYMQDNYRPAQPLNGRSISRNFKELQCSGAFKTNKPAATFVFLLAVAIYFLY